MLDHNRYIAGRSAPIQKWLQLGEPKASCTHVQLPLLGEEPTPSIRGRLPLAMWVAAILIALGMALLAVGTARAQSIKEEPAGCLEATAHTNGACKLTYANGNTLETLADGSTWATIHPDGQTIKIELGKPAHSEFLTHILFNLPPSDIVGAPQSEELQIDGDCQSRRYNVELTAFFGGPVDAQGASIEDLTLPNEGVIRRVEKGTVMELAFNLLCKEGQ